MLGRLFLRQMSSGGHGYGGAVAKRANLNDFPVPHGSWQEAYKVRQTKNNAMLAFGFSCLAGTFLYIWKVDPFKIEYVLGPYKFMHNPPAFESPLMEPNILLQNQSVDKVAVATAKK